MRVNSPHLLLICKENEMRRGVLRDCYPYHLVINMGYKTSCWIWQRACDPAGYGKIWDGKNMTQAHRIYYKKYKGPIPEGLHIDHLCRQKNCVNPDHLEAVLPGVNNQRNSGPRSGKLFRAVQ